MKVLRNVGGVHIVMLCFIFPWPWSGSTAWGRSASPIQSKEPVFEDQWCLYCFSHWMQFVQIFLLTYFPSTMDTPSRRGLFSKVSSWRDSEVAMCVPLVAKPLLCACANVSLVNLQHAPACALHFTAGSARLGSARLGSARLGSARLGSARLGSARLGSARLGSARLGSARLGSARLGSARLGSARLGSARLGSARLG